MPLRKSLIAPEATPCCARPLPWVAMHVSVVVLAIGVTHAVSSANANGDLPIDRLLQPDELEAQQDVVSCGAMLGSVLTSFGASGLVTTMPIVLDDRDPPAKGGATRTEDEVRLAVEALFCAEPTDE